MKRNTRGYDAYLEGAIACDTGLPRTTKVHMDSRYLRLRWLEGWHQTNNFRQRNMQRQGESDKLRG
jgi:hypothetical protein